MCVSHSRGATCQINGAREVQGECRAKLARAMLSCSLHSRRIFPKCDAKVQKIIMQTKLFNSYFSIFLEILKCKILFREHNAPISPIPKILPSNLRESSAFSAKFSLTIHQILPYHPNRPFF